MRQNADSFLESICYRSTESLVSLQSILAHQRSIPLYTLNCKKAEPWRINPIRRSKKKQKNRPLGSNDNVPLDKISPRNPILLCEFAVVHVFIYV